MCVIVDANQLSSVFSGTITATHVAPVIKWLFKGDGCLVYSSALLTEIKRVRPAMSALTELRRAGRALDYGACKCPGDTLPHVLSNDVHVIALAIASGARVVVTHDTALMADVKNKQVLDAPRGRVYSRSEHAHLLTHNAACRAARRARLA